MNYIFNDDIIINKGDSLFETIKKFTRTGSAVSYPFGNEYAYISDVHYKNYSGTLKLFFADEKIVRFTFDSENFQLNSVHNL